MSEFSPEEYSETLKEIHHRKFSADAFSRKQNVVSTVIVNAEKLNHREKSEWHAQKINELLAQKTTIFYPFPSRMNVFNSGPSRELVLIFFGYTGKLSPVDSAAAYKMCGEILHAQHPLRKEIDIEGCYQMNKPALKKIKAPLASLTIGIRHDENKFTFLFFVFDLSSSEASKPTLMCERAIQRNNRRSDGASSRSCARVLVIERRSSDLRPQSSVGCIGTEPSRSKYYEAAVEFVGASRCANSG